MGSKKRRKIKEYGPDSYSDFDYDPEEEFDDIGNLAEDFYSTDWENPFGNDRKISARRKIERRADYKALCSEFDDWDDDYQLDSDWY